MNTMSLVRYQTHVTVCPICREAINTLDFVNHTFEEHPYFFVVWASLSMPDFHSQALLDSPNDVDDMSYEFLSELCDRIGYHRQGITNVDEITSSVTFKEDRELCPICLESMEVGRKINACSHHFCDECIRKWLADHKTCPVCIRDLTSQIAETSISSAPPAASDAS